MPETEVQKTSWVSHSHSAAALPSFRAARSPNSETSYSVHHVGSSQPGSPASRVEARTMSRIAPKGLQKLAMGMKYQPSAQPGVSFGQAGEEPRRHVPRSKPANSQAFFADRTIQTEKTIMTLSAATCDHPNTASIRADKTSSSNQVPSE